MKLQHSQPNEYWPRRAVLYHVYPLSFKDIDNDGKGDLKGIIEKLDYLNDGTENSLGVEAIWLSPVYASPMADFGYDISDHYTIDPTFGDLSVFDTLIEEAHRRGIKVLMDFVPNHTSSKHPWFRESRSSRKSQKRDWYIWKNPKPDGSPPNNWISIFGGSAWTYSKKTKQYYLHTFFEEQPDLNWRNDEVRKAMFDVIRFWLKRGVDGFRTDALYHLMKDEQFRDDPPNPAFVAGRDNPYNAFLHIYSSGQEEELVSTTNVLCEVIGERKDTFMISESYVSISEMMKLYRACSNRLHAPFNFNLISLPWDAKTYRTFIDEFEASLDADDLPNYVLGNHDRSRIVTRMDRDRARLMALLLFTLRGLPVIYYGEEIGMENVPVSFRRIKDPLEKRVPGFNLGRDPERSPMQWSKELHAGFSRVKPWLPVAKNYILYNVESESKDPRSMLSFYRKLIHYRKHSPVLLRGSYRSFDVGNKDVFAYFREHRGDKLMALLNFSAEERSVSLPLKRGNIVSNTFLDRETGEKVNPKGFLLRPHEGYLLEIAD